MKRVKWDLDQLKEVQKQQEVGMTSTEQVINKARNDLNSMTEEVWEGEDGDMARELLGDLVYKEMPQTWKEIDAINTAIKKAQKTAYESKNFCNEFAQIFKDGSLPSETDSAECSGELLCDRGSCDVLKAAMDVAGKNAANVKRNIETVENILSELETPEAKFDYTSYTEPIKEQAQNVVDRTKMFNNAVSIYESKVREMDETLARELMEAIPSAVPGPFDPFCLHNGKTIKMGGGDIVEFIEALKAIELGGKFGIKEIQAILKILFGKEKVDISDLTEAELELAFIKLTKDQQKAILLEMGLTAAQIAAILAAGLTSGLAIPKAILGKKLAKTIIEAIKKYLKEHNQGDDQTDNSGSQGTEDGTAAEDIEEIEEVEETVEVPEGAVGYGSEDKNKVRLIQRLLQLAGISVGGGADGIYGSGTAQAVIDFIEKYGDEYGLTMCPFGENGELTYVDEKTLAALYAVAMAKLQEAYGDEHLDLDGSTVTEKDDWVRWAIAQNGYYEGSGNDTPFGEFTNVNNDAWCASFVSWCLAMAGDTTLPYTARTSEIRQSAIDSGLYRDVRNPGSKYYDADYVPKAGDVFYRPRYDKAGNQVGGHVGFITSVVDNGDGTYTIKTMEGNMGKDSDHCGGHTYTLTQDELGTKFEGFVDMDRDEKTSCSDNVDFKTDDD